LPGTEGAGVADVLFRGRNGKIKYDFSGKLSFSWPKSQCQTSLNVGDAGYDPLFPYGYGLRYGDTVMIGALAEPTQTTGCGQLSGGPIPTEDLRIYDAADVAPYVLFIGSPSRWDYAIGGQDPLTSLDGNISVRTAELAPGLVGKRATWHVPGGAGQLYSQSVAQINLAGHDDVNSALVFDAIVHQRPTGNVAMRIDCSWPCIGELSATSLYNTVLPLNTRVTVKIPTTCFSQQGTDMQIVDTPFLIFTDNPFEVSVANVRWVPGAADDTDAFTCDSFGSIVPK
jgi:beta-glucosidase